MTAAGVLNWTIAALSIALIVLGLAALDRMDSSTRAGIRWSRVLETAGATLLAVSILYHIDNDYATLMLLGGLLLHRMADRREPRSGRVGQREPCPRCPWAHHQEGP